VVVHGTELWDASMAARRRVVFEEKMLTLVTVPQFPGVKVVVDGVVTVVVGFVVEAVVVDGVVVAFVVVLEVVDGVVVVVVEVEVDVEVEVELLVVLAVLKSPGPIPLLVQ